MSDDGTVIVRAREHFARVLREDQLEQERDEAIAQRDALADAVEGLLDLFTFSYEGQALTRASRDRRVQEAVQRAREALDGKDGY